MFLLAVRLIRSMGATDLLIVALLKFASVAFYLGRGALHRQLVEEAASLAKHSGDRHSLARCAIVMAGTYLEAGDAINAEREIRVLLDASDGIPEHSVAEAYGILALSLRQQKRLDAAIPCIERAIPLRKASRVEDATMLFYAGVIYHEAGDSEAALRRLNEALHAMPSGVVSPLVVKIHERFGDVHFSRADLPSAEHEYESALSTLNRLWRQAPVERDRLGQLGTYSSVPEKLVRVLLLQDKASLAFDALEQSKARTFLARLGLGQYPAPASVPDDLSKEERECLQALRTLHQQAATGTATQEHADAEYARVSARHDKVLGKIAIHAPEYVSWRRGSTLSYDEVRRMLGS